MVNCGELLELTKLSECGPYSEASVTTLRVTPLFVAPVQGEEEHGPPPGTVLVSVRKEGNTPPCMKPLAIRLTVPVHRASPEGARRYAMCDGGGGSNWSVTKEAVASAGCREEVAGRRGIIQVVNRPPRSAELQLKMIRVLHRQVLRVDHYNSAK